MCGLGPGPGPTATFHNSAMPQPVTCHLPHLQAHSRLSASGEEQLEGWQQAPVLRWAWCLGREQVKTVFSHLDLACPGGLLWVDDRVVAAVFKTTTAARVPCARLSWHPLFSLPMTPRAPLPMETVS